jgi:cell division protein FtsB
MPPTEERVLGGHIAELAGKIESGLAAQQRLARELAEERQRLAEEQQRRAELARRFDELRDVLAGVEASTSFRLGRLLTAPARRVKAWLRG